VVRSSAASDVYKRQPPNAGHRPPPRGKKKPGLA
jgi:hypothetical protein